MTNIIKNLKSFYLNNKKVLIILFFFSLTVLGYYGVSTIINIDGLDDLIIDGSLYDGKLYLSVGRWGWALICTIFNFYPSPFFNMIFNSVLFSISSVLLSKIFNIKNKYYQILIGMILIVNPLNLIAYSYSAWQFSIGISYLLIIYACYLLKTNLNIKNIIISALLMSFAIGIYQIFICFIATLLVYLSICTILDGRNLKENIKKICYYLITIIIASLIYYIITKLTILIFNVQLSSYQSANTMFSFNFKEIFSNLGNGLLNCLLLIKIKFFPIWVQLVLILLFALSFFLFIYKISLKSGLTILFLSIILIIAPRFLVLIKPNEWYHEVTLLPYTIFFAGGIALLFKSIELNNAKSLPKIKKIVPIILSICIIVLMVNDNQMGVMAKKASDASFATINRMISKIEDVPNFNKLNSPYKIYFADTNANKWLYFDSTAYTKITGISTSFVFTGTKIVAAMNVLGFDAKIPKLSDKDKLKVLNISSSLPKYPASGSISIYKDIIIVNN